MTAGMITRYITTYPRPWGLDILAMLLFALTAGVLLVTLGTRSEVVAAPRPAVREQQVVLPPEPPAQEADPFLPPVAPPAEVSIESQQKILKIINGE